MQFTIRKAVWSDILQVLNCLQELNKDLPTDIDKIYEIWAEIVNSNVQVIVYSVDNKILGVASYFIERKFIHQGGYVCHIEDVAILKEYQSKGIGASLIKYIIEQAKLCSCYKIILDCVQHVSPFYTKLGFYKAGLQLRYNCDGRI